MELERRNVTLCANSDGVVGVADRCMSRPLTKNRNGSSIKGNPIAGLAIRTEYSQASLNGLYPRIWPLKNPRNVNCCAQIDRDGVRFEQQLAGQRIDPRSPL